MIKLPEALIFDLDDTLVDFDSSTGACWRAACHQYAVHLPGTSPDQVLAAINDYRHWFWSDPDRHRMGRLNLDQTRREIVYGALKQLGIDSREDAVRIGDAYTLLRDETLVLFPDTIDVLEYLRTAGIPLAMITNGNADIQRSKIERFNLEHYFDTIIVEGEFGIGKPDERVYLHALRELGAEPSHTWMVGDNLEWEVAAPQKLGIQGIWFDVRGTGLPEGSTVIPDRIIRRLTDLIQP
ncbi:MAG: HAD family hydrolase [Armatimonadota bacterium]